MHTSRMLFSAEFPCYEDPGMCPRVRLDGCLFPTRKSIHSRFFCFAKLECWKPCDYCLILQKNTMESRVCPPSCKKEATLRCWRETCNATFCEDHHGRVYFSDLAESQRICYACVETNQVEERKAKMFACLTLFLCLLLYLFCMPIA